VNKLFGYTKSQTIKNHKTKYYENNIYIIQSNISYLKNSVTPTTKKTPPVINSHRKKNLNLSK